ncbi:MAG TPA: hypothetical protein VJH89_00955, partial [Patescibacteria group bacterium]|nr:hypothetical protein [Patescibacteria group bacterium]
MFDQLIGLLLLGLGIQSPVAPSVKGETTENVLTEQSSSSENTDHVREQARIKVLKDAAKKDREAYRVVLKNTKETFRATIEASRTAYKASLRGVRETFAQEVEAKREEAKAQVQSAREAFEKKLHEIRDERKQKL